MSDVKNKSSGKSSFGTTERFETGTFYIGNVKVEPATNTISSGNGESSKISARQMSALSTLAAHYGEAVSRAKMHEILCLAKEGHRDRAALSHHIGKIRRELGDIGKESKYIKTIRGGGYYLLKEPTLEPPMVWEDSPYRGLKSYRFQHAPIFFGRTKDVNSIVAALQRKRNHAESMIWLSGASGVGKSSLIEAGVLPELYSQIDKAGGNLIHAIFRYRSSNGSVFDDFSGVLINAIPNIIETDETKASLSKKLSSKPELAGSLIAEIIREVSSRTKKQGHVSISNIERTAQELVIVVDQVDEIIASSQTNGMELENFFTAIVSIARSPVCTVIGAVRLDYLPRCLDNSALAPVLLNGGLHIVRQPSLAEVRDMVERPAEVRNLKFEQNTDGLLLSDVVVQDAFPDIVSLPVLGFTLELLYRSCKGEVLSFSDYERIGGLQGCLAKHCDDEFNILPETVQSCLGGVLSHLTTAENYPTQSISAKAALWAEIAYSDSAVVLLEAFIEARIFTIARDQHGAKVVHLAHEAVLSTWNRAKIWVDENLELIRVKSKLTTSAANWMAAGRDRSYLLHSGLQMSEARMLLNSELELSVDQEEYFTRSLAQYDEEQRRKERLRYKIAASAVIFAILSLVASGLGYSYWKELANARKLRSAAEHASYLATVEREVAESTSDLMIESFSLSTPQNEKDFALSTKELLDRKRLKIESDKSLSNALQASHFTALGRAYFGLNEHDLGVSLLERSLSILRKTESPDQLQLARTLSFLAESLSEQTHTSQRAREYLVESINILKQQPGTALQMSKTLEVYANVQQLENDFAGAEVSFKEALIALCSVVPDSNRQVKALRVQLGRNLTLQSKFEQAESISREVLRSDRVELSENDPQLVGSLSQYAYYLYSVGRYKEAINLYREALNVQQVNYAPDHWRVARSKGRLGHLLVQDKQLDEAQVILSEAVEIEIAANGVDSISAAIYKVSLADALEQVGAFHQAKTQAQDAISIINLKDGPTAGLKVIAENVLGASLAQLGNCNKGVQLMQKSLKSMQTERGNSSPYTKEMKRRLSRVVSTSACEDGLR